MAAAGSGLSGDSTDRRGESMAFSANFRPPGVSVALDDWVLFELKLVGYQFRLRERLFLYPVDRVRRGAP